MKKAISFLCLMLILSGCTKTVKVIEMPTLPEFPSTEMIPFENLTGKAVTQPDSTPNWVFNTLNLTYENAESVLDGGLTTNHQFIIVDGLTNETVQKKINQTIFDVSNDLKRYSDFDLAPTYRGLLKQYSPQDTRVDAISISTYESFNFNNLLSLNTQVCVETNKSAMSQNAWHYRVEKSMTFDLNTGNLINLGDLFITGSDYVSRLNELIMLDIQSKAESSLESEYYVNYTYLGGFTGIRGDVGFFLTEDALFLTFDHNYPEFFNDFQHSAVIISLENLRDILAISQRYASEASLFTTPPTRKLNNYLTVNPSAILVEKRDQSLVRSIITLATSLTESQKSIADNIIAKDQEKINLAVKNKVTEVWYKIVVFPVGPYMNVDRVLYAGEVSEFLRVTYKPNGSPLTFADVFRAGFDYKSLIIVKMKKIASENQFPDEYDYEAIFKTMNVMVYNSGDDLSTLRVFNMFQLPPAIDYGTFDVWLTIKDYPNDIIIKAWAD